MCARNTDKTITPCSISIKNSDISLLYFCHKIGEFIKIFIFRHHNLSFSILTADLGRKELKPQLQEAFKEAKENQLYGAILLDE